MSSHPVASTSTAAIGERRTPPLRFGSPVSHNMPWSDNMKPANGSFRPGHSASASVPAMNISTPLSSAGIPILPPATGARVVRTPRDALEGALSQSPHAGSSRLSPRVIDIMVPEEQSDVPPTPPAKPFAASLAIRTRSPQRESPRSSPQRKPGNLPSAPSSPTGLSHHLSPTALVSPPPPPFKPILLSPAPIHVKDQTQIIVKLETETATFKTTFHTLTSRPSLLASLLHEVVTPAEAKEDPISPDPTSPLFGDRHAPNRLYDQQVEGSNQIHIFLDRPSDPYAHILAYLRATGSYLPHAVKLSGRLEELIALRDEARFLDLHELAQMCADELLKHRLARGRTGGITQVAPLAPSTRSKSQSPRLAPAPIVTQLPPSQIPHSVHIVHPDDEQLRSAVARRGFI